MTDCPNATVRDRLPDLLHGALDAPSRAVVEAHVAGCPDCASELSLLREAQAALSRAPQVDVAAIVAALPRPAGARRPAARPRLVRFPVPAGRGSAGLGARWGGLAAAAALVVAVGVGSFALGERAADDAGAPVLAQVDAGPDRARASDAGPAPLLVVNTASLSDADLAGLLDELDDLEAVPAADPMSLMPVAELPTASSAGDGP